MGKLGVFGMGTAIGMAGVLTLEWGYLMQAGLTVEIPRPVAVAMVKSILMQVIVRQLPGLRSQAVVTLTPVVATQIRSVVSGIRLRVDGLSVGIPPATGAQLESKMDGQMVTVVRHYLDHGFSPDRVLTPARVASITQTVFHEAVMAQVGPLALRVKLRLAHHAPSYSHFGAPR